MSIIHDALKKAAAEKEDAPLRLSSLEYHSKTSTALAKGGGVSLLLLFVVFLSTGFYFFRQEGRDLRPVPIIPPPGTIPEAKSPPQQEVAAVGEARQKNTSGPSGEEGEKALLEGLKWYRQGEYERATRLFKKAITVSSQAVVAHNNLGLALRQQGKIDQAISHYKEAIRLDPNYAEAHNNLGMAQDFTGSIDQAGEHYRKAIDLKPFVPEFHLNYATWLERKGEFGRARREYQSFLQLSGGRDGSGSGPKDSDKTVNLVKSRLKHLKVSRP